MTTPDQITIQKIDFLVRGISEGKFDEVIKRIEFVEKLDGQLPPSFLKDLLNDVHTLETDNMTLQGKVNTLQTKVNDLETKCHRLESEMMSVAKAISYLFKPEPLSKSYNLSEIQSWLTGKGIY